MKSSYYVGVSFYKGQIQLAELDHGKKMNVTALNERSTSIDFAHDATFSADHPQLFTFVYELEELLKQNKVHAKIISFALPTEPLLINVIPVDAALQPNDLTAHIHWEFEQYFPGNPAKDFIVSAYPVPGGSKTLKHVFLVAVRKGLITFLKRAAKELRLDVHLVDIDHFSAEKTLRHCHPELLKENLMLFGLRGTGVDASVVSQGQYTDYRYFSFNQHDDVKKCVLAYKQYLEQKNGTQAPAKAVFYGSEVTAQSVSQLQRDAGIPSMALDAVRNMLPSKKIDPDYVKESARFAAAIGLALRTQ